MRRDRRRARTDADRVAELFDRLHDSLYRLARRLSRDPEEARDLVQEAFLRAAREPANIPAGDGDEEAWLTRVLVNLCRDRHRRLAVRRRAPLHDVLNPPRSADPENRAVARDAVQFALQRLPPRRRAVLVLCDLEERTTAEVARRLGLAKVTVRWHLAAARKDVAHTLRQVVPPTGPEGDRADD